VEQPQDTTGLEQYLTKVRDQAPGMMRGEAEEKIESLLNELGLPWGAEPSGDLWKVRADVGEVFLGLNEDDEILSIWQLIHSFGGNEKKEANYLATLLRINESTQGACFSLTKLGDQEWVMVVARIAAQKIDKEELALALKDVFAMSQLYDSD
jgi:hypothetical protein